MVPEKRKQPRFRFTLAPKMMIAFVIFGLAIGYLTFFLTSFINPLLTFQRVTKHILENTEALEGSSVGSAMEKIITSTLAQDEARHFISPGPTDMDVIKSAIFYLYDPGPDTWSGITLLGENPLTPSPPGEQTISILENLIPNNGIRNLRPDVRKNTEQTFFVEITEEGDVKRYALGITVYKQAIRFYFRENHTQFIIFDIIVGIFSVILGMVFSRMISRPISRLSRKASQFASGDLSQRFRMYRRDEIGSLAYSLNTMANEIERRLTDTEKHLATMETMNKIDKAVLSSTSRADLLDRVMGFISGQFGESRTILILRNDTKQGYDITAFTPGLKTTILKDIPFLSDEDLGEDLLRRSTGVFQTSESNDPAIILYKKITGHFNSIRTMINTPIYRAGTYVGSIIMTKPGRIPYGDDEISFIRMLADQVGVAIQSVLEVENREALNMGILMALTKAIDAKSPWTAGHSERVATYSESIGIAMNMNEHDLHELTISALLHDIGKIGVPESILNKPDKLTDEEFSLIKTHPGRGADILNDIPEYAHVLEGVEYHHERWDGSGYPHGTEKDQIPFFARIIAVADVYDAVTYDRPYRKGMSPEEAVTFMQKNKGTMFDSDLVDLFLETFDKN